MKPTDWSIARGSGIIAALRLNARSYEVYSAGKTHSLDWIRESVNSNDSLMTYTTSISSNTTISLSKIPFYKILAFLMDLIICINNEIHDVNPVHDKVVI